MDARCRDIGTVDRDPQQRWCCEPDAVFLCAFAQRQQIIEQRPSAQRDRLVDLLGQMGDRAFRLRPVEQLQIGPQRVEEVATVLRRVFTWRHTIDRVALQTPQPQADVRDIVPTAPVVDVAYPRGMRGGIERAINTIENMSDEDISTSSVPERKDKPTKKKGTPAPTNIVSKASMSLALGKYDEVIALRPQYDSKKHPELEKILPWAYVMKGIALANQAKTATGKQTEALLEAAGEKYDQALKIMPNMHEPLNNWGATLIGQAKMATGKQAEAL